MSSMKTIDVMEGDKWTLVDDGGVFQYRNKRWRGVYADTHESEMRWSSTDNRLACEIDIPAAHAKGLLSAWGYKITPAAKPEANSKCQQESKPETLTQAKPADVPATVKPELTVPLVDAVWVEDTMADGSKSLTAYSGRESAESCAKLDMERGRARIVRIRTVDEHARDLIAGVQAHLHELCKNIAALESRLAAEKPADKDAAKVVKAPGRPVYGDGDWRKGVEYEAKRWRAALADAGITVEAAE